MACLDGGLRSTVLLVWALDWCFYPRDAMRKRGLCCRPVSVCPSVRPSVTLVHCIHMAEDIVKLLVRSGRLITLVFVPLRRYPIPRETLSAGAQNTRGNLRLRFSTETVRDRSMVTMEPVIQFCDVKLHLK